MPFPFAGFDGEIQIEAGMGGTQNVVRSHLMNSRRQRGDVGFSAVLLTLCLGVMVAMLGLAIDCGRMFITKNELQTFVDASALAAVSRLDGTREGVAAANAMATAGPLSGTKPNGVNFGTGTVLNVTNTYATTFGGTYASYASASFGSTNNYRFIRVTGSADVPLNFLPVLPGISRQYSLTSAATAGQQPKNSVSSGGLLPFAPDAHNPGDTRNFGFTPGTQYTLKWGNGNTTTCAGDAGFTPAGSPPSEHGFVDIGEGNSNDNVRAAIRYGGYPNSSSTPSSIAAGDGLGGVPGNRGSSIFDALADRASQDTDNYSSSWAQYKASGTGNGRRIVTVPVAGTWSGHGSNASTVVLGFANFLLNTSYAGTSGPICATYIGPGSLSGNSSGGTDGTKVYTPVLYK